MADALKNILCRNMEGWHPSPCRKNGEPWKTNRWATTCHTCGDTLLPGEAMVGSFDETTNRILWSCGAKRWDRP